MIFVLEPSDMSGLVMSGYVMGRSLVSAEDAHFLCYI